MQKLQFCHVLNGISMLIPLNVVITNASPQNMFIAWIFYVVTIFSMHYHVGTAFGFWDPIDSFPRKLDITFQILSFPFFAFASSGGNAVFTLTCAMACFVPLLFAWLPGVCNDESRWRVNAVLGAFVTCGLLLQGKVLLFICATCSAAFAGVFFLCQHLAPALLFLSRFGLALWLYFICLSCPTS